MPGATAAANPLDLPHLPEQTRGNCPAAGPNYTNAATAFGAKYLSDCPPMIAVSGHSGSTTEPPRHRAKYLSDCPPMNAVLGHSGSTTEVHGRLYDCPPDDCRVRAFWECNRAASAQATALDRRPDPGKRVELQGVRMCGADRCNCLQLHGDWLCRHKV